MCPKLQALDCLVQRVLLSLGQCRALGDVDANINPRQVQVWAWGFVKLHLVYVAGMAVENLRTSDFFSETSCRLLCMFYTQFGHWVPGWVPFQTSAQPDFAVFNLSNKIKVYDIPPGCKGGVGWSSTPLNGVGTIPFTCEWGLHWYNI